MLNCSLFVVRRPPPRPPPAEKDNIFEASMKDGSISDTAPKKGVHKLFFPCLNTNTWIRT